MRGLVPFLALALIGAGLCREQDPGFNWARNDREASVAFRVVYFGQHPRCPEAGFQDFRDYPFSLQVEEGESYLYFDGTSSRPK